MGSMNLRKKLVVIGMAQLVLVAVVLMGLYYFEAKQKVEQQFVEKARSVVLTAEGTREQMGKKWDSGLFSAEQLRTWADAGQIDKVLQAVPVVTAWQAAMAKAKEGGYTFKTPKFDPRNPANKPDVVEARVLKMFQKGNVQEHYEYDPQLNAIRYFRPVRLTQECMLCHGDPATAAALWGHDDGTDPTGHKMENWKVGEVHGAFEIIQSLDAANAQIWASLLKGGGVLALLVVLAGISFYFLTSRSVIKPLRHIINGLTEGAEQVNDAAAQVAASSQSTAEGASMQASSIEQTSSALEEMAAQTRSNAEHAQQASELANNTRQMAEKGNQTMGQLDHAMTAINESSAEISKIIKIIEEIAFQTNLLALNAAVEAARAGEHGKGFAVVADEVRNLAQRSAEAARDTNRLISESVERAREGSQVSDSAAQILRQVVDNVSQVADLINGISAASNEQAQGVDQINSAVATMDKVTQQNAAGAEQAAAAAEELTGMANSMRDQFVAELVRIVEGGHAPVSSGPQGDEL